MNSSWSAQSEAATLTLVDVKATNTNNSQNWKVDIARRTAVGTHPYGTGIYQYTLPQVIPPSGAAGKLTMTIRANQRWATGFSLSGNVDFSPQPAIDESTAQHGLSFTVQRKFTIKPRAYAVGTKFVDIVGHGYYNEGPTFTFRYRVDSGVPKPHYKLLLWTNQPDGRMHTEATRINQVNRGPKAGINLTVKMPQGSPPPPFLVWFEQRPPGVPFVNGSIGNLVICTYGIATAVHCRIHSPGYPVSGSSLQGIFISPRRHQGTFIDLPITRFFRVTGRDQQGRVVVASNTLKVTWTEAD